MKKYYNFQVLILLVVALVIRIYAAGRVPLIHDEILYIDFVHEQISFDLHRLRLPLGGNELVDCPLLVFYLIKFSSLIFGEHILGYRLLFVLVGVLSLLFFYKIVAEYIGRKEGLLTLFLLTFSQFHIGLSRFAIGEILLVFFTALSVYFFLKTVQTHELKWLYSLAVAFGIGYLCRELILLLIPVFLTYILLFQRDWFIHTKKEICYALCLTVLCMMPSLIWSYQNNFVNYTSDRPFAFGISTRTLYMYFAEVYSFIAERYNNVMWDATSIPPQIYLPLANGKAFIIDVSPEYPYVHWPISLMITAAFFYYLINYKRANQMIRFFVLMFGIIFVMTSVIAGSVTFFDDHTWGAQTYYAGIILSSHLIVRKIREHKSVAVFLLLFCVYLVIHAIYYIRLPQSLHAIPKQLRAQYYLQ